MSIKPEYAFKIFEGSKKFEFRKTIFKDPNVKTVVVYASSPVQKVIGEFEIDRILSNSPELLWEETQNFSGISELFFFQYFENKDIGHAIKIKNTRIYDKPKSIKDDFNVAPPQSFAYLRN